ncbi:hypothetical protein OV090_05680 [Nannocystis sp. RBIL2]|uniref:hypothetical protein n=1 Tax=Nannocystis sp. RBIL2 TaxID=2996788 RepID=UPI00226E8FF9|nr:hypothetical protein [Nannocystis sp. RBIL2]MCY1064238.1 hypothetical protein [Nannocystis sp. RBIL2]
MRFSRVFLFATTTLALACKDDSDPLATAGPITASSSDPSAGSNPSGLDPTSEGSSGSGSSGGDPTGGEPTGGETGEMSGTPYEWCQRYLACLAVIEPNELPGALAGFGKDSDCWTGSASDAELCQTACVTGLEQYHPAVPDEPACFRCNDDSECDPADDASCIDHGCIPACGNGEIELDEVCELSIACEDCKTGVACSPYTGVGCEVGYKCVFSEFGDNVECVAGKDTDGGVGEVCEDGEGCGKGLYCLYSGAFIDFECAGEYCCAPYCNLTGPDTCPEGADCQELLGNSVPQLDYVGLCTW